MVLMAIVGELGSGKTLSLTYLAYRNYLKYKAKGEHVSTGGNKKIYSNYGLFFDENAETLEEQPYVPVDDPSDINQMQNGFFAGDEMWLWLDSRASRSKKNTIISKILLRSRKRGIHIAYTTQAFGQIDKRIRDITDLIGVPQMNPAKTHCQLYMLSNPSNEVVRTYKFDARQYFDLYDTSEEIDPINMDVLEGED